jgi:hypothetical protein
MFTLIIGSPVVDCCRRKEASWFLLHLSWFGGMKGGNMTPIATRCIRSALVALAIAFLLTSPVQAGRPLAREHYSVTDSFSFSDCGFPIDVQVTLSGLFMLKEGHHGDPTPYYFDNYNIHYVLTNPANGKWVIVDRNGLYKDVHITHVEGTIYRFESIDVGQPNVIRDMDGNVLIRESGLLKYQFTVDTKGDNILENDEFLTDFEVIAANGRHPFIDFCGIYSEVLW